MPGTRWPKRPPPWAAALARLARTRGQSLRPRLALLLLAVGLAAGVLYTAWAQAPPSTPKDQPKAAKQKHPANRLAKETSPYLLLHAHNPVDWHPWGEEALAKAKAENKLIFLSIGYSSCYWCHVMERESFMDEAIAAFLNRHFVCIKVDREERPDIDEIYMTALQITGERGGWPLSMFLTPAAKPVFGGTYFPPRDKEIQAPAGPDGTPGPVQRATGFLTLIEGMHKAWQESPQDFINRGDQIAAYLKRSLRGQALAPAEPPDAKVADQVLADLTVQYDEQYGGFGFSAVNPRQPKFPEPSNLLFLIDHHRRTGNEQALAMLTGTLDTMAAGGIRDHVGGGFHRYSTDRYWRVPHFEKMLYDNGQLATVYAEAFQLTGRQEYRQVTDEILAFVVRELTDQGGGFYSALDAETDAEEGRYYVWTREELERALAPAELELAADAYGFAKGPNFDGRSVLLLPRPLGETAARRKLSEEELLRRLAPIREKLLAVRGERERPLTDTKILTDWNGLMIRGFADAGRLLENKAYVAAAARAADFVLENLRTSDGRLLHAFAGGQARFNAYLDDYALLVDGLIALHQATDDGRWLAAADELMQKQLELFWDEPGGGFYFTSDDHEELLARSKDPVDSVIPSGNAVSAGNLVYLSQALGKPEYLKRAEQTVTAVANLMSQTPTAVPRMVVSWMAVLEASKGGN